VTVSVGGWIGAGVTPVAAVGNDSGVAPVIVVGFFAAGCTIHRPFAVTPIVIIFPIIMDIITIGIVAVSVVAVVVIIEARKVRKGRRERLGPAARFLERLARAGAARPPGPADGPLTVLNLEPREERRVRLERILAIAPLR
jgi:hypothetical protein